MTTRPDAPLQEEGRGRVPEIVEPDLASVGAAVDQWGGDVPVDGGGFDGVAVLPGEDIAAALPLLACFMARPSSLRIATGVFGSTNLALTLKLTGNAPFDTFQTGYPHCWDCVCSAAGGYCHAAQQRQL